MRSLILYQKLNGIPRRLLSVSARVSAGHGDFHEGDDAVPREFIQAAYILSEDQRPSPMVLQQRDMTPELIAEKAAKYNILPEDYTPMSVSWGGAYGGDYPTIIDEACFSRPFNYEWDNFDQKRNYGQVIGMHEWTHYGQFHQTYDGQFHAYGIYQFRQHIFIYIRWVGMALIAFFLHHWVSSKVHVWSSWDRWVMASQNTHLHKDRSWSKQELEWLEVFLMNQQAIDGYANRSYADQDTSIYRIGSIWFGKNGQYCGRNRRGPEGESPINSQKQDTYMCPAGPMSFKMGHNMPIVHPGMLVWNTPHPGHGHGNEMADMLSTEVGADFQ